MSTHPPPSFDRSNQSSVKCMTASNASLEIIPTMIHIDDFYFIVFGFFLSI